MTDLNTKLQEGIDTLSKEAGLFRGQNKLNDDARKELTASSNAAIVAIPATIFAAMKQTMKQTLYVSGTDGDDKADGTKEQPFQTCAAAVASTPEFCNLTLVIDSRCNTGKIKIASRNLRFIRNEGNSAEYTITFDNNVTIDGGSVSIQGFDVITLKDTMFSGRGQVFLGGYSGLKIKAVVPLRILFVYYNASNKSHLYLGRAQGSGATIKSSDFHLAGTISTELWQTTGITE